MGILIALMLLSGAVIAWAHIKASPGEAMLITVLTLVGTLFALIGMGPVIWAFLVDGHDGKPDEPRDATAATPAKGEPSAGVGRTRRS